MNKNVTGLFIAIAFVFGLAPITARAQQDPVSNQRLPQRIGGVIPQNPVSNAMRQMVKQHAKWLIAGAEEYPANKLNYRPTPQQWTFGHLMFHISHANEFFCSRLSGEKAPPLGKITPHSSKAKLLAAMKTSFNFCEQSLRKVNDSEMDQKVDFFGGHKMTKGAVVIAMSNDMADHYAQESMYLRLNGHLPPTAQHHGK